MDTKKPLYTLTGQVVHGRGRGHKVNMPTANLQPDPDGQQIPPCGVYATISFMDGEKLWGVTNVGSRPTVDKDPDLTVETYYPGYSADLYGRCMQVDFYLLLRNIRRFSSLDEVKRQVEEDARCARTLLGGDGYSNDQRGDGQ